MGILDFRSLEATVEERSTQIAEATRTFGARRVAIDSLAGLQLAVGSSARTLPEVLLRLLAPLQAAEVSVVVTAGDRQVVETLGFLADNVVEIQQDNTRRSVSVVKMRTSGHCLEARPYSIGCGGCLVGETAPFRQ